MSEEFLERQRTIRDNVKDILERFPSTRDNKWLLLKIYLKEVDGFDIGWIPEETLQRLTRIESIFREMRKLQNELRPDLKPNFNEQTQRAIQEDECHDAYGDQQE